MRRLPRIVQRLFQLPFHLVLLGIAVGYGARLLFPPESAEIAPRKFETPIATPAEDEFTELPLI